MTDSRVSAEKHMINLENVIMPEKKCFPKEKRRGHVEKTKSQPEDHTWNNLSNKIMTALDYKP